MREGEEEVVYEYCMRSRKGQIKRASQSCIKTAPQNNNNNNDPLFMYLLPCLNVFSSLAVRLSVLRTSVCYGYIRYD